MDVGHGFKVFLPFRGELSKIMPESGEVTPLVCSSRLGGVLWKHFRGKPEGPVGDFVEVAVCGIKIAALLAGLSLALRRTVTKWSEQ